MTIVKMASDIVVMIGVTIDMFSPISKNTSSSSLLAA